MHFTLNQIKKKCILTQGVTHKAERCIKGAYSMLKSDCSFDIHLLVLSLTQTYSLLSTWTKL